jgi:hypothetical protein
MVKLPVAAFGAHQKPSVIPNATKGIADFS